MRRMMNPKPGIAIRDRAVAYSLTVFLTCLATLAQSQNPINPVVPKAMYLVDTDQSQKALKELEEAIAANPTDASLLYYLGYVEIKAGHNAKALTSFDNGIKLNDKEALNYAGKGYISLLEKKEADAKIQFDKALTMTKSKNAAVLKAVAEAYLIDNKYSVDAVNLLKKAASVDNTDPEVQILLGDAYLLQNSGGPAITSYERASTIRPSMARPHFKIGMVYERSKNTELALENFKKAIAVDPKYTLAYRELGEIYYMMGAKEAENAVKSYETFLSLTENPGIYEFQYAFFLFIAKDYKKANAVFSRIAGAPDVKVVTLRFYANSLFEDGDFSKSREIFEKYFEKAKAADVEAKDYADYGKALQKLKQDSLATVAFTKCLAINPDQQEILQLLGDTYYKTKKFGQAIETYQKLMSKRKEGPKSLDYFSIGRAYYNNNQLTEADTAFSQLIRMQPEMVVGYKWKADTESLIDSTNTLGLAKPTFEKVIEKASTNPEKNKRELVSAYRYLGYYYYDKKDYASAKTNYEKVLTLLPGDVEAQKAIDILTKPAPQPQQKKPKN